MTLLSEMETEVGNLTTRTGFHYADLEEANATIFDKLQGADFPVCLILPFDTNDVSRENGVIKSEAEVNALFLNKFQNTETIDKPQAEIEAQIIAPMRTLTREWINRMDDNDIISEDGITSVVHRSVHQAVGDAHLYGNWAVMTIKFNEGLTVCPPH